MLKGEEEILNAKLEVWDNQYKDKDYLIEISFPEFTCKCPLTGYPDFATIKIKYIPDKYIVELKSLKLYLNKFREKNISHENVTNQIYDELYNLLKPRYLELVADWNPRGNVKTVITINSNNQY